MKIQELIHESPSKDHAKDQKQSKIKEYLKMMQAKEKQGQKETMDVAGVKIMMDHITKTAKLAKPKEDAYKRDILNQSYQPVMEYTERSMMGTIKHRNIRQPNQTNENYKNMIKHSKFIVNSDLMSKSFQY